MRIWTYSEIKTKIEEDLDLEDETFITDNELLAYANEAVDEAEAEIHTVYEDYFLTKASLALVQGTEEYALPEDIYGNKIRRIMYRNGGDVYTVARIRDWRKFEEYTLELAYQSSTRYRYFIINSTVGAPKIVLSPPAKETSAANVTIWYLRNANRFTDDDSECDIPEFVSFVIQYMKVRCYEKEGNPLVQKALADLEQQRAQMNATLTAMVVDDDNEMEPDLSIYNEHT